MPDGEGYVVLDNLGGREEVRDARRRASVGAASTPYWGIDLARDIVLFSAFGMRVRLLRARRVGAAWSATSGLAAPHATRAATLFRDRWRGITIYGGKPLLLRNDGTTTLTN